MTEADLVLAWARAFAVTLAVELAVATPLLARNLPSIGRRLALVTFAQLSTHPVVWFVLPALHLPRGAFLATAEFWACAGEALLYAVAVPGLSARRATGVAVAANAASFVLGHSLRALGAPV